MPVTPIYGLRYPSRTDKPNGRSQIKQLAEDVEAAINNYHSSPTGATTNAADETGFTTNTFTAGTTSCSQVFVAPRSGAVLVLWHARFESDTAALRALVSVEIRTGGAIGEGTVVSDASDSSSIESAAQARCQGGMWRIVTGLTAGDTYHARTMHKMHTTGGSGDVFDRSVAILPL